VSAASDRSDAALFEILGPYLEAFESGEAPDREEFLARHPDHREQLEACLASLDALHAAGGRASTSLTGETLGDFEVGPEIGRGGMGVVYEARQASLDRPVALKVLLSPALLDPARLRRFQTEALAAAHLQHPHIVPVHAVGCEGGVHFYAMQRIAGMTLAQVIGALRGGADPPFPAPVRALVGDGTVSDRTYVRAVARLGAHAAEALEHAHRRGIVHRDVKPGNLILDDRGHVFVADFGLASFRTERAGLTLSGDLLGTLRYMSPEQARAMHAAVDHRTDVYSLGVTLYELLTLERAFPGESAPDLIEAITKSAPPSVRRKNRHVPTALETVVAKAMAKEPEDRYEAASDLARDLDRILRDEPISVRPPSRVARAMRSLSRKRRIVAACLIALAALLVVGLVLDGESPPGPATAREKLRRKAGRLKDRAVRLHESGDEEGAAATFREARAIVQELLRREPSDPDQRRRLAICLAGEAQALLNLGRPEEALTLVAKALPIRLALTEAQPKNPSVWSLLANAHQLRGQILWELGRPGVEAAFRSAVDVLENWPPPPDVGRQRWWVRAVFTYQQGLYHWELGEREAARACFRKAVGGRTHHHSETAWRAWILAMCPDREVRDPAAAVDLARRALAGAPSSSTFRMILGAALLRAEFPHEAAEELKAAWNAPKRKFRCGVDFYLAALACSKSGRPEAGRKWFDIEKKRDPRHGRGLGITIPEIRAVRAEAAALLGVADD
jgi:serine/threonine protein kinase